MFIQRVFPAIFLAAIVALPAPLYAENAKQDDVVDAQDIHFQPEARGRLAEPAEEDERSFGDKLRGFFSVRELDCRGNTRVKCDDITTRLAESGALALTSFSYRELGFPFGSGASTAQKILKDDPWVEQVTIEVSPFSRKAVLSIQEAIPWFVTELRGQTWVVSRRGALLQELSSIHDPALTVEVSQLPRVRGVEVRGADSLMREAERVQIVTQQLAALEAGGGAPFEVESYELLEDNSLAIVPFSASLPTVFFRAENGDEGRLKLRLLKEVMSDAQARGERLSRLDLRVAQRAIVVRDDPPANEPQTNDRANARPNEKAGNIKTPPKNSK